MAVTLKFKFQLSKHAILPEPTATLWVDTDHDGDIAEEDRVDMKPDAKNALLWTAESQLKVPSAAGVGFVLKFVGDPDAKWSLRVSSGEKDESVVYDTRERAVEKPFRTVMGWCK